MKKQENREKIAKEMIVKEENKRIEKEEKMNVQKDVTVSFMI